LAVSYNAVTYSETYPLFLGIISKNKRISDLHGRTHHEITLMSGMMNQSKTK